jgi:hypothetical protein
VTDPNPDGSTPVPPAAPPGYDAPSAYPAPAQPPAYGAAPPAYGEAPPAYGSAPAYGAPAAYGTAPAYGAPYGGYAPAKTNTLAIVSLISSLVGLFIIPLLGSITAVITGHMSLGQIKQTGEQGRGLALAGLIIGYVGLGFMLLGIILLFALLPLIITSANTSV